MLQIVFVIDFSGDVHSSILLDPSLFLHKHSFHDTGITAMLLCGSDSFFEEQTDVLHRKPVTTDLYF